METTHSTFSSGLDRADWRMERARVALANTRNMSELGLMKNAFVSAFSFAFEIEELALLARALPAYTGHPRAAFLTEELTANVVPVRIGFTQEGWFSVSIPALLPKKARGSPDYIRTILYPAMRRFFDGKAPVSYPSCVMIFRHVYDRTRPERMYRDHDNIETNMVTDIVALYVMVDDAALRCAHYYCSAAGNCDRTEVYVVHPSKFVDWLVAEKSFPDEGVNLRETYP